MKANQTNQTKKEQNQQKNSPTTIPSSQEGWTKITFVLAQKAEACIDW